MTLDALVLGERAARLEWHLGKLRELLPQEAGQLDPEDARTSALVLHLWQAVQLVIDVAVGLCALRGYGTPANYADAFALLERHGVLEPTLAMRLAAAARFRNLVAHAYGSLDYARVHEAAREGPADLRAFLRLARELVT